MKFTAPYRMALVLGLVLLMPAGRSHSQLAPVSDPLNDFQALESANDDLLKRQEATLKELTDMTGTANQVRIFSARG